MGFGWVDDTPRGAEVYRRNGAEGHAVVRRWGNKFEVVVTVESFNPVTMEDTSFCWMHAATQKLRCAKALADFAVAQLDDDRSAARRQREVRAEKRRARRRAQRAAA